MERVMSKSNTGMVHESLRRGSEEEGEEESTRRMGKRPSSEERNSGACIEEISSSNFNPFNATERESILKLMRVCRTTDSTSLRQSFLLISSNDS
jgi:hypothetical protein